MHGKIFYSELYKVFIYRDSETRNDYPIPPKYRLRGEFEFKIRLKSTRGGSAAWWYAGDKARESLNEAPYQPMLRAIIGEFEWSPRSAFDYPEDGSEDVVIQGGSEVPNFLAKVVRPIPDPVKEFLSKCETSSLYCLKQGHLTLWKIDLINGEPASEAKIPFGREIEKGYYFLNHWISYARNLIYRVISGKYIGMIETVYEPPTIILSSDHFHEPLILAPGIWLLIHPFPTNAD
jgi:hypothetical protein